MVQTSDRQRMMITILKELQSEVVFTLDFLSFDWIVRVSNGMKSRHIMGYDWELNSATAHMLAKDKAACYELLSRQQLPAIEHRLFLNPTLKGYVSPDGNWDTLKQFAALHNYQVVCKSNTGTGGNEVFRTTNQLELERYIQILFAKHRALCLSPFYPIEHEYRIILLNDQPQLVYRKEKPHVVGDGVSTALELIQKHHTPENLQTFELQNQDLAAVIPANEVLTLGWKHNLGKGSKPIVVENGSLKDALAALAIKAARLINIQFASVDIVETTQGLHVMEINSGIMMENYACYGPDEYAQAKATYKAALIHMMELP